MSEPLVIVAFVFEVGERGERKTDFFGDGDVFQFRIPACGAVVVGVVVVVVVVVVVAIVVVVVVVARIVRVNVIDVTKTAAATRSV